MMTGMMWFDSDPKKPLEVIVAEAARYYFQKYGRVPQVCMVHPKMMPDGVQELTISVIKVKPMRAVMPRHIWIGVE